jgi:hypothetical protein
LRSSHADGVRASEVEHAVEDHDANGDLGDLRLIGMEVQRLAEDALSARHLALHASPLAVAAGLLPPHPPGLADHLDVTVALGGSGLGRVA